MVAPTASTSCLIRQLGGLLLSSASSSSRIASAARIANPSASSLLSVRHSHVGSAPLDLPTSASIEVLPFPPHPNPSRPLLPSLRHARSVLVRGPKGEVIVPLHECIVLNSVGEHITLSIKDDSQKKQRGMWGLTRSLLANALEGVSEGHTVSLKMVGVGYRASIEADPLPRRSKLDVALAGSKSFFLSEAAKQAEIERAARAQQAAEKLGPNMRLHIRLGYSHPVLLPVPHGIQVQVPQPNRIVLKGADKEQLGLFASQIRSWRKPEPYKGKGIFVNDETIRLKTAKKK
ncbi:hypothetical protein EX895_005428 [Sporisorium graminicola]|uniref:Large ribosomal subunit protein uL6 alpha-beta domain-containing protein n=1 Tax=Sporisorium graminicola TaxID=280036 RepID=A0A4U7KPU4_9BASI|nr:hypothetical protein EX895_005428 [Sporisorium graminicola]TKY85887.1 hypothetical protein EX895_005428 [Sporisorium graminicola]